MMLVESVLLSPLTLVFQIGIIAPGFFYWALFVQMCCISFIPSKYVTEVSSGCISYNYFLNALIFVALWQESPLVSVRPCSLPDSQQSQLTRL